MQQSVSKYIKSVSKEWFEARRSQITASKTAHQIIMMTRTSADSLLQDFLNPKMIHAESVNYGIEN